MPKFRKKPVVIEAIQLTETNPDEILGYNDTDRKMFIDPEDGKFKIETLEGIMVANVGDWIIRGINNEFYPCKPDIFKKTYEPVKDDEETISKTHPEHDYKFLNNYGQNPRKRIY